VIRQYYYFSKDYILRKILVNWNESISNTVLQMNILIVTCQLMAKFYYLNLK
jgi:hypothetical protein